MKHAVLLDSISYLQRHSLAKGGAILLKFHTNDTIAPAIFEDFILTVYGVIGGPHRCYTPPRIVSFSVP